MSAGNVSTTHEDKGRARDKVAAEAEELEAVERERARRRMLSGKPVEPSGDISLGFLPRARGCVKRNNGEIRRCSFPPTRGDLPTKARRTVTAERRVSHL